MAVEETNVQEEKTAKGSGSGIDGQDMREEPETEAQREAREKKEAQEREARAKKRRLIPPFVMLFAGAVTSITMRLLHYEMKTMLIVLLCVLIGFYIAGSVLKYMLDKFERQIEEAAREDKEDLSEDETARKLIVNEEDE